MVECNLRERDLLPVCISNSTVMEIFEIKLMFAAYVAMARILS